MRIILTPQRRHDFVVVSKNGETLTINDDALDFAVLLLADGSIPDDDTDGDPSLPHPFVKQAKRVGGELTVTLILPHGPNPDQDEGWPQPIEDAPDGVIIDQPAQAAAKVEAAIVDLVEGGAPEEALRAAVATGRAKMIADGWSACRADRQLLGVIREWQTTGELVAAT